MNTELLIKKFEQIGARLSIGNRSETRSSVWQPRRQGPLSIDVQRDRRGEFFSLGVDPTKTALDIVDVQPAMRHLLLLARLGKPVKKEKFLCGHDERAWFVAAIPQDRGVSNVRTAMEALKPAIVREAQERKRVRHRDLGKRRTKAYVRQGEWFFVPRPDFAPAGPVLENEPISRGNGSKPHICEYLTRGGGETVYVCGKYPTGVGEREYRQILSRELRARSWGWQPMLKNAAVWATGRVRHPDHKTIQLDVWHEVAMNSESRAPAMRHVVFLD